MSEQELEILLMGYVDDELDAEQRARVEAALKDDEGLRRELASMRALLDLTRAAQIDEKTDRELDRFWGTVYNRTERHLAWALIIGGTLFITAAALLLFFKNDDTPMVLRVAVGCAILGTVLMFASVLRERMRLLPHDRYSKEVHR
ncbi:MAG: zf-HC2 domain-containing protein [Planctomycetota bacterium]|jgi:hypothetical protein